MSTDPPTVGQLLQIRLKPLHKLSQLSGRRLCIRTDVKSFIFVNLPGNESTPTVDRMSIDADSQPNVDRHIDRPTAVWRDGRVSADMPAKLHMKGREGDLVWASGFPASVLDSWSREKLRPGWTLPVASDSAAQWLSFVPRIPRGSFGKSAEEYGITTQQKMRLKGAVSVNDYVATPQPNIRGIR